MRLRGKSAFVTAAGAGIGKATARRFAAEGASVAASDIDGGALAPLRAEGVSTRQLDVTDAAAVAGAARELGAVDILFNCAGFVHHGTILDTEPEAFDFSMRLNVTAMYRVVRAFLPAMLEAGGGRILNMSSVVSSAIAAPNRFVYGTSKAAVIGLTKSVAADFVTRGIRCNAICPGTVDTPSLQARVRALGGSRDEAYRAFASRQPLGRLGTAEEVAGLAVWLASDEADFVTGQAIAIDGGWTNL